MQLFKSGIRSNKIATLAGLVLAAAYLVPELVESTYDIRTASYGEGRAVHAKGAPLSVGNSGRIPTFRQSDQFDMATFDAALEQLDYQLAEIRSGYPVPRLYIKQMPVDIADIADVEQRKKTFIKIVLPLILSANEKIMEQRERLATLLEDRSRGEALLPADRKWLDEMAARYREDLSNPEELLLKVDSVPVSLALAQAVEESGWGTSRFAQEGNALFGQRVWSTGKGIVPEERAEDETHEVKAFRSIADSIRAYIHNLNTHAAYAEFREVRAQRHSALRNAFGGQPLIETLHVYSEKGREYVDNLRSLIRTNQFDDFDDAILMPEQMADNRP